ncbi:MAG TPA: hypothetical protein PLH26_14760 [Agriterribacter sp.]|nr:hypothetical protein [Agriterribacter sp.]
MKKTLLLHAGEMGKQDAAYKATLLEHLTKEEQAAFVNVNYA